MLRRLNKRAQTTAEYAILIAIVVGALVGMQIYVRRGIQGRIRDVVDTGALLTTPAAGGGTNYDPSITFTGNQFEPYYLGSGEITQTATGGRGQSGSTETQITSSESAYETDRSGTRTSIEGIDVGGKK